MITAYLDKVSLDMVGSFAQVLGKVFRYILGQD